MIHLWIVHLVQVMIEWYLRLLEDSWRLQRVEYELESVIDITIQYSTNHKE